jgi:hypothetical protein
MRGRKQYGKFSVLELAYPDRDGLYLPRCRCGLLLPCNDCLPTNAVDFAAQRMAHLPTCVTGDDR